MKNIFKVEEDEVLEQLQEAIVNAGGKFFYRKELRNLTLERLLEITVPNHIHISTVFVEPKNKPQ